MLDELLPELARHLVEAGLITKAVDLFANRQWINRRAGQTGLESVLSDERIVMSAALGDRLDSQVVRLIMLSDSIRERFRRTWDDGSGARRIAVAGSVEESASVARSLGDDAAPWADFLAAARALQLGSAPAAHQILESVSVRPWPRYAYRTFAHGLPAFEGTEGRAWVYFFCQVFSAAPEAVARLTQRLCAMSGSHGIPSRYTVWAAVLDRLVDEKNPPALIMRAVELAHEVILPGTVPFGYEMIYTARLRAIEAIAGRVSPMWLGRQLTITLQTFQQWKFKGPDDDTTYRAITPLIEHFVILKPLLRDPELGSIVDRTKAVLDNASFLPPKPRSHHVHDRSYLWAGYARSLEGLNPRKAAEAAALTLTACEIDAGSNDPPRDSISRALALLESSNAESTADQAKALRIRLGLPTPEATEPLWSPGPDAKDPFQAGLNELARGQSRRQAEENMPAATVNAEVVDAIRLGIMTGWLRAPAADAITHFREHAEKLSANHHDTYKMSWSSIVARRATALEDRGMSAEARTVLTDGFELALHEGDKLEDTLRLVSMLALYDSGAAWGALERLGFDNPIDVGSAVAVVMLTLLKENHDGVEWWLDRLPAHTGNLCSDEHFLLVYGGGYKGLSRALTRIAGRTRDQFREAIFDLLKAPADGEESSDLREKLEKSASLAATFGAFAFADQESETQFSELLDILDELAEMNMPLDVIGTLLSAFADSKIRSPVGTKKYLNWLRKQDLDSSTISRFFDAKRLTLAAVALYESAPAAAHDLVAEAFELTKRKPVKPKDPSLGIVSIVMNVLAGGASNESALQLESRQFADAVASWAGSAGDKEAARELEEIGRASDNEEEKSRLLAGAAKTYFALGCVEEGARCLPDISEGVLERMEVLGTLAGKKIDAAHRREVLGALLVGGLRSRECLSTALELLFQDVVDAAEPAETTNYLRGLATSLEVTLLTLETAAE